MRQLFLLWFVSAACNACARTRGGGGGGTPGAPAPRSPGGQAPGVTEAPPKVCPPLMSFSPDPAGSFQLVSPPTTTVSGDTTTATCPAGGTSFLLPDGTSTTAALSCSTTTGTWSFADGTPFDATTTGLVCGAKCAPCMITQLPLTPPFEEFPTGTDSTDQCNTPTDPVCTDMAGGPLLVGVNMDGTIFTGALIVEPVMCVGGKWVDASNAVYDNLACNPPSQTCPESVLNIAPDQCNTDTGKTCVAPTALNVVPYTGTNALLQGEMTLDVVCPLSNPVFYMSVVLNSGATMVITLNTPLSAADVNFICNESRLTYLIDGITLSGVNDLACASM